MSKVIIINTPRGITFLTADASKSVSISKDHQNYHLASEFTQDSDFDEIFEVCSEPLRKVIRIAKQYKNSLLTFNDAGNGMYLEIHGNTVAVPPAIAKVIIVLDAEGGDITPLVSFLENMLKNPNKEIYQDIFAWLQAGNFTLTEDGHFLAYKKVREDYKDIFSGTMDNSVGATPSMPRSNVTTDRNQTCAAGLHWCSWDYLAFYGGAPQNRIMIVKVNPADVDRIPTDYDRNKGVSWAYTVVAELAYEQELDGVSLYRGDNEDEFESDYEDDI